MPSAKNKRKGRTALKASATKTAPTKKSSSRRAKPKAPRTVSSSDAARIIAAVKQIPRGRVCTYGAVADVAGLPRRARLVGTVLRQTPSSTRVPWFRVINASGRISFPQGSDSYDRQRKHLESEGVDFVGGRIDLNRYGWPEKEALLDELLWAPPQ